MRPLVVALALLLAAMAGPASAASVGTVSEGPDYLHVFTLDGGGVELRFEYRPDGSRWVGVPEVLTFRLDAAAWRDLVRLYRRAKEIAASARDERIVYLNHTREGVQVCAKAYNGWRIVTLRSKHAGRYVEIDLYEKERRAFDLLIREVDRRRQ